MYVIVVQYFDDVVKEGGADGWQPFREENDVGKGVGEHGEITSKVTFFCN